MIKPLSSLYLFPVFQTREDFARVMGTAAPPFNPARPVKSWFDAEARKSSRRSVVYDNAIAMADSGRPLADENGHPYLEPLLLDREFAATVNIPVKDFSGRIQETPTIGFEVPVPCRELAPGESLFFAIGGAVMVTDGEDTSEFFGPKDRALLVAIAQKLGV